MPALQTTVLKDRTPTTPVDHTFTPESVTDGVGIVTETSGVPIGNSRLSVSSRKLANSGKYKAEVRLVIPTVVTETINGVSVPKVAREAFASATFTFDPASSEQERNDLVGMFADAFATGKTLVNDTVIKLQGVYR